MSRISEKSNKKLEPSFWRIEPSFKYDVLCFLNVLSADPFYLQFYQKEYDEILPKLTSRVQKSLSNLRRIVKEEYKSIISAFLCMYFSATTDETISEMIHTIHYPYEMQKKMQKTTYYEDKEWQMFESIREDLEIILQFLNSINFYAYWQDTILPKNQEKIEDFTKDLSKYKVIPEDELVLGYLLPSREITVYVLNFTRPHGIRITGSRFLTDNTYPFIIVVRNAIHEMLHPPFDLKADQELREILETLKNDELLMDKVVNHNPDFGYNTFEDYIEEDCVHALEQIVSERLKIEKEPHKRWKESDDGMHVFAVALYKCMKEENYNDKGEIFRDFLVRKIKTGVLKAGKIKELYNEFYQEIH